MGRRRPEFARVPLVSVKVTKAGALLLVAKQVSCWLKRQYCWVRCFLASWTNPEMMKLVCEEYRFGGRVELSMS